MIKGNTMKQDTNMKESTRKICRTLIYSAFAIAIGCMFSLLSFVSSYADDVIIKTSDIDVTDQDYIDGNYSLNINESATLIIDATREIKFIYINNNCTLTIQGNGVDTLTLTGHSDGSSLDGDSENVIMQSGNLRVLSSSGDAIYVNNLSISGGTLYCEAQQGYGIELQNDFSVSGGSVTAKGGKNGIYAANTTISAGTVEATICNSYAVISAGLDTSTLTMSGGELTTKVENLNNLDACTSSIVLTYAPILSNGVTIVEPAGREFELVNIGGYDRYVVTDAAGNMLITVKLGIPNNGNGNGNGNRNVNVVPGRPGATGGPEVKAPQLPPCAHTYEWRVINAATATSDGEEDYVCTKCGDVKEKRGLPALGVFETETANKILNAKPGATVYIECMPWNSFGHAVRDAIAKRLDVTVKASFLSDGYKGTPLKVTIPAGRVDLFDSNGYLGLCRAGLELGYDN